jgi:hypothetical protein
VFRFDSGVHDVSGWQPGGPVRSVFERLGIGGELQWQRLDHRYSIDGKTIDVPRDWRDYAFSTGAQRGGIPGAPGGPTELLAFAVANPPGGVASAEALDAYRQSPDYLARKLAMGDALIARARHVIPDIEARIVYRAESTPVTYYRYAWSADGAIYGTGAAQGRLPTRTPLRNLVLAGAATHGPGIEAVVISGAYAAEALRPGLLATPALQAKAA